MKGQVIEFESYEIMNMNLTTLSQEESSEFEDGNVDFEIVSLIRKDLKHAFLIIRVNLVYQENKKMDLEVRGSFNILQELDKNKAKMFIEMNGFTMLYPYVRSIVSFITTLDSKEGVIMPVLNVNDLYNN